MSRISCYIVIALVIVSFTLIYAQEEKGIEITEMNFCTDVQEREPIGVDSVFSKMVGTVYCFTLIEGAADTISVEHIWYHNDEKMAEVSLLVGSTKWRTWSSKKIMEDWVGKWRVDIILEGDILRSEEFQIED